MITLILLFLWVLICYAGYKFGQALYDAYASIEFTIKVWLIRRKQDKALDKEKRDE